MRIIFIGPPGSGKGTQCRLLADHLLIPHLSTGEIIRERLRGGDDQAYTAEAMGAGRYAPDQYVMGILTDRIAQTDCQSGYLLDGFPRTSAQAALLESHLAGKREQIDRVIFLSLDPETALSRLRGRALSEGRSDDSLDTIKARLEVYHRETEPVLDRYRSAGLVDRIGAVGDRMQIHRSILSALRRDI